MTIPPFTSKACPPSMMPSSTMVSRHALTATAGGQLEQDDCRSLRVLALCRGVKSASAARKRESYRSLTDSDRLRNVGSLHLWAESERTSQLENLDAFSLVTASSRAGVHSCGMRMTRRSLTAWQRRERDERRQEQFAAGGQESAAVSLVL